MNYLHNEKFFKLDGNLYKINENENTCFLYTKSVGFVKKVNCFEIKFNGIEISKNEAKDFILRLITKRSK